jgi:hypothetical protein
MFVFRFSMKRDARTTGFIDPDNRRRCAAPNRAQTRYSNELFTWISAHVAQSAPGNRMPLAMS